MALFQASVLTSYLKLQEEEKLTKAFKKFSKYFHHPEIQENIRNSKEEQFQATFLNELFVNVMGYTLNPNPSFDLTTEFKNEKNSRKADGAILIEGKAIGVIELKGTNTKHLEGIRQQAFDYKANQKGCIYVITSNFEKLRFYINDATEFVEFDLFELNRKDFDLLYLCLHKENIAANLPLKIKEFSIVKEEQITKEFYKDYSVFKRELYRDLVKLNAKTLKNIRLNDPDFSGVQENNPDYEKSQAQILRLEKNVKLELFKKSQKLIDRFLFIFFAEDRNLLPPNSTILIVREWEKLKDMDAVFPLYERFKLYFSYLDQGRKGSASKAEIYAYNGGLFKPDNLLDRLEISDELLAKHTTQLSKYDFASQVDVNILGHIFENSLNEIESVSAEIEGGEFDKQKSKRKKDGVFYTPKYITKYIVENTVGRLCEEKKSELGFREEEYFKGRKQRQTKTLEGLIKILDDYRTWLLQLTICDPACGSGAFLNQALDFLIKEHRYIDEMKAKLLGGGLVFSDIETTILENNIYGVDINEESVEIAKLSLWLRTAQPRRKLNDLSSNIKCGNSLIDDKKVAGIKAFKWEKEFKDVFAKGGFDVVIGNPPYVRNESIDPESKKHFENFYQTFSGKSDLYVYFFEKANKILKEDGKCGFIASSKYTKTKYGKILIDFLQENSQIYCFIDFKDLDVFKGIVAYPSIILFSSNNNGASEKLSKLLLVTEENYQEVENQFLGAIEVEQKDLFRRLGSWSAGAVNDQLYNLVVRLEANNKPLIETIGKPEVGIKTGYNTGYILKNSEVNNKLYNNPLVKKYFIGREIKRYEINSSDNQIIFPYKLKNEKLELITEDELSENRAVNEYLLEHKTRLSTRAIIDKGIEKGSKKWYEFQQIKTNFPFQGKYIIYPDISEGVNFMIVENAPFDMTCFGIASKSKSLLGILNSKLILIYLNSVCVKARGGYLRLKTQYISKIPVPQVFEKKELAEAVEKIITWRKELAQLIEKFTTYISTLEKVGLTKNLQNWH